jgi:hypothetical protein
MSDEIKKYKFTYIPNTNLINNDQNQSGYKYTYKFQYTDYKFTIDKIKYDMEKLNEKKNDFMALHYFIISKLGNEDFNLSFDFKDNILTLNINTPINDEFKNLLCGENGVIIP